MSSFSSFVPGTLVALTGAGDPNAPAAAEFTGVAMFADMTGYTELAERLCVQGIKGTEELSSFLDRSHRRHVNCINRFGGEIACFAGDGLLIYWKAKGDDVDAALRNAKDCASSLHELSHIGLEESSIQPDLHIGLAAGRLWAARLGGIDRQWQILLAGRAVRDAAWAVARAGAGETLLRPAIEYHAERPSERSRQAVPTEDSTLKSAISDVRADADAADVNQDALVPRVVQEWTLEGRGTWLPQIRNVCALFARIDGLDEGAPDALDRYQAAVSALLTAVRPYTGSSGELWMDDKGLLYKLCLGLPHDAHSDIEKRALRAGLSIESGLRRLGLNCAIGVASGHGVCATVGGRERMQYVSVGRFMHVAARLMQSADQGLLCTANLAAAAGGEFDFAAQSPVRLKGVSERIQCFRVRTSPQRYSQQESLHGRDDEKGRFASYLEDLKAGQGAIAWITGDAGVGKSALVRFLDETTRSTDLACFAGGAASVEHPVSFLAWRPVFRRLLQPFIEVDEEQSGSRQVNLPSALGLSNAELAPLINSVLPGLFEDTPLVQGLSGEARVEASLNLLCEVIQVLAPARFVLMLEDCHWMDSASWQLVERVARSNPHALIVLTSRPLPDRQELVALRRLERFTEFELAPLQHDAIARMVDDLLLNGEVHSSVHDEIIKRSAGNPLFAREYTLLLESTRRIVRRYGTWRPAGAFQLDAQDSAPLSVQGLITSRLDTLSPEELMTLRAASVIGDQFQAQLLEHAIPKKQPPIDLRNTLDALAKLQLLVAAEHDDHDYRFRHSLYRIVAYSQLTTAQRQTLHQRTASAIEELEAGRLATHYAALANHWSIADVPTPALKYADLAASQALSSGAYLETKKLLSICIELSERRALVKVGRGRLVKWHRQLADAHHGLGNVEDRGSEARRALYLGGLSRPRTHAALSVGALGRAARLCWRRGWASHGESGSASTRGIALELAECYRHSAAACWFSNDLIGMTCDSLAAAERASIAPESGVFARAYAELGAILGVASLRAIGERILRQAQAKVRDSSDSTALAYVHLLTCLYAIGVGDWSTTKRSSTLCRDIYEDVRDFVGWSDAQAVRFWSWHYQGHTDAAEAIAQSLTETAAVTGNRQHQAWALRFTAVCDLRRNKPAKAAALLESALEVLGQTAALNERIPVIGSLAVARLDQGDTQAAYEAAREGLRLLRGVRRPLGHATLEGYSGLTHVVLSALDAEPTSGTWQRGAQKCLRVLRRYRAVFPIGEPRYRYWQGHYLRLQGRLRPSLSNFMRAATAARSFGMPWEEAQCAKAILQESRLNAEDRVAAKADSP